ncbi:MAG: DNA cytosine methyltransferase [Alphaproteobacteria bacterium]
MRGGTMFSGIGAPECAAPWVDWRWCAEIDPFPSAVHAARFPGIPNLGDVTAVEWSVVDAIDLLVFGSPCQSFSIAGKRAGLDDARGNLTLVGLAAAGRLRPRWLVWENVPGVLSIDGGRTFGAVLGALAELGYGFAYRVLDAQHFGVPQRRRRVFVVGHLGDWRHAAAVLFERASLSGHPPPRGEAGKGIARPLGSSPAGGSGYRNDADTAESLIAFQGQGTNIGIDQLPALRVGNGYASGGAPMIAHRLNAHPSRRIDGESETFVPTLYSIMPQNSGKDYKARPVDVAQPVMAGGPVGGNQGGDYVVGASVRRLTPTEAERLQGFPDSFTAVSYRGKPAADGPRYRCLGNSMAVPCIGWILERVRMVDEMAPSARRAA